MNTGNPAFPKTSPKDANVSSPVEYVAGTDHMAKKLVTGSRGPGQKTRRHRPVGPVAEKPPNGVGACQVGATS